MAAIQDAVIVSAARTPVGKFGGAFVHTGAVELGTIAVREAVRRASLENEHVEEVIMGNVLSAGLGQAPARQCAVGAGIPYSTGAVTVNKVCGSGLKAIMLAANSVRVGEHDVVVAGGMESMSNSPYLLKNARWGSKYGDGVLYDEMILDGLWDAYNNIHMMITGEIVAERFHITREEADSFALRSHRLAVAATREGFFRDEIVPVPVRKSGTEVQISADEGPRPDTSPEKLASLVPKFKSDGICTAGNSSQLSDGAAAVVVTSERKADELGLKPLARIVDYNTWGTRPEWVMEAPIETVRRLLQRNRMTVEDVDLFEHNEAYATASVAVMKTLEIDERRFNISGGAVALGHPLGASGARIAATLIYNLKRTGKRIGLLTLCLGGGNAVAMLMERM